MLGLIQGVLATAGRRRRRPVRVALRSAALASIVAAMTLVAGPVQAHDEPLIQPGAPVYLSVAATPVTPCTLNFVFRDRRHTYIGTTARCASTVGERAAIADREFGTVVFRAAGYWSPEGTVPCESCTVVESVTHTQSIDDFALIRVDASELHRVSPVVMGVGRSPRGVTPSGTRKPGDLMFMTGQGVPFRQTSTEYRLGALTIEDGGFHLAIPASLGDGGAPVVDASFNAYGVLASSLNVNGPYGTTMERVMFLLDLAGFDLELVTGFDKDFTRS
jgi:hypothetical protein